MLIGMQNTYSLPRPWQLIQILLNFESQLFFYKNRCEVIHCTQQKSLSIAVFTQRGLTSCIQHIHEVGTWLCPFAMHPKLTYPLATPQQVRFLPVIWNLDWPGSQTTWRNHLSHSSLCLCLLIMKGVSLTPPASDRICLKCLQVWMESPIQERILDN